MPRGLGDIPDLRLEVLQNFIETFMAPPELVLSAMFPASNSPSSTIKWESREGGRGMTPFVPPGAPAPVTAPYGVAAHSAETAFWKEKMYFDEEFLNNLRKEGTASQYLAAQARLAREMAGIVNRCNRRREWMFAKMISAGSFSYSVASGPKISVDYSLPTANSVTLTTDYQWQNGTKRDILTDVIAGKRQISETCGGKVDVAIFTSQVLEYLAADPTIQTLLQKSAYGAGNLFGGGGANPIVGVNPNVIGALLDIPNMLVYDQRFEVRAYLTGAVTADSTTTISVDDSSDFEVGGTLRFVDTSAGTWEEETISAVSAENLTVTVSTAPSTSYKAGEDYVTMIKTFIPEDLFIMLSTTVDGQKIAEYKRAPFALDHHYGMKTDRNEVWDPEGIWIRVQDKGLPVLYQRDAIYILDVN